MPTKQVVEDGEELEFKRWERMEREEAERRCPSLRTIPRFYVRCARDLDENSMQIRVMRAAFSHLLHRKSTEELLDDEDLHVILGLLQQHSRDRGQDANLTDAG